MWSVRETTIKEVFRLQLFQICELLNPLGGFTIAEGQNFAVELGRHASSRKGNVGNWTSQC